jgi:glucose-6-phosphate isomerase
VTITVTVKGETADTVHAVVPDLVLAQVASRLAASDSTLWGEAAEAEASIRLGWFSAAKTSRHLVDEIEELR